MFMKALTTALVSATLLAGALQTPAFADMGGGGDVPPWAEAQYPNGSTVTSRRNRDGSRTVTERSRNGDVVRQERVGGKKKNKPKKRGRPWASAYDPATGTRTTSVGLNQRGSVRAVISIGPFGIGFGISN